MIDKVNTIKNPLTIIAIFAGIAEISGTVVLPLIAQENQANFIWFLMVFPHLLIVLFFATLNWNHKVLYAPSDYKDEDNFIKSLPKASPDEKAEKRKEELASIESEEIPKDDSKEITNTENLATLYKTLIKRSAQASYILSEELIFDKLSKEFSSEIQREVKISNGYIFDGLVKDRNGMTAIEVKFLRDFSTNRLKDSISKIAESTRLLNDSDRKNFKLLLVVTTDQDKITFNEIKERIDRIKGYYPSLPIELRFYKLTDLEKEFENNS